jgi:hypothetical protein
VYTDLPKGLGYDDGAPELWSLPVLTIAGVVTACDRAPAGSGWSRARRGPNPALLFLTDTQPSNPPG